MSAGKQINICWGIFRKIQTEIERISTIGFYWNHCHRCSEGCFQRCNDQNYCKNEIFLASCAPRHPLDFNKTSIGKCWWIDSNVLKQFSVYFNLKSKGNCLSPYARSFKHYETRGSVLLTERQKNCTLWPVFGTWILLNSEFNSLYQYISLEGVCESRKKQKILGESSIFPVFCAVFSQIHAKKSTKT